MEKEKRVVIPGDFLGTLEEFMRGSGVYDDAGNIYASVIGEVSVNEKRVIAVVPETETLPIPREGDVVIGRIEDIKDMVAIVSIACIKGKEDRGVAVTDSGIIHISNVRSGFVSELPHEFGYLDIVKAKVIDAKALKLSTERSDLGVIKAMCMQCKSDLKRKGNVLVCERCKRTEIRKIADDYGKGII
jgi:exosome complex component CSL4